MRLPLLLLSTSLLSAGETPPFLDPNLFFESRAIDYLGRLTLEQKADLLDHRGPDVVVAGFTLRSDQWNQCLHGVCWSQPTTQFPVCIALGATWNPELVQRIATVLSDEARAINNGWKRDAHFKGQRKGLIYRAPVINISRNPYWGRIHEVWSEDPFLTGRMGVAYVRGLQGDDAHYLKLAATLKHYAVNNVDAERERLNATVPERDLHEYWLPHFRDAVVEGRACSLMASYNAINGTPNNINRWLLTDLLKRAWKHEGFVVSDLGGVRTMVEGHEANRMTYVDAVAQSVMAGCDFSDKEYRENIPAAVRAGKLTEDRLDDAVLRVIGVRMRLGEFDPLDRLPWKHLTPDIIGSPAHRELALTAARQAVVLLTNTAKALPLDRSALKSIAVIGPHAQAITLNNYSCKLRDDAVTAFDGLRNRAGSGIEVRYAIGGLVSPTDTTKPGEYIPRPRDGHGFRRDTVPVPFDVAAERQKAVDLARRSDVAVVFVGTNTAIEMEGRDRKRLGLPGDQLELVQAVFAANPRTIVVQMSAGPLSVPWIAEHIPAVLQGWWAGEETGNAIAEILFGDVNPSGRLPYTVYASDAQVPSQDIYDVTQGFTYMYVKGAPLYPFGHGLSYSTFTYADLAFTATAHAGDTFTATLTITNTGTRAGDEVVQIYVHEPAGTVVKPYRRLVGFTRVPLAAGERRTVSIPVAIDHMCIWDATTHAFVAEPGTYELQVGASSTDIRLTTGFTIGK